MIKKIISILIILTAISFILFYAGIIPENIFTMVPEITETDKGKVEEKVEEKEMAQLRVGSKIIGKSIEIENIQITDNAGKNKVLTDVDGKGKGVWVDIDKVIERSSAGYSDRKIFYILGVFLSAFLLIYFLKPRKTVQRSSDKKKDNQNKLNLLDHEDK